MTMKQLTPVNPGGGLKRSAPSAHINAEGALVLNVEADEMIKGEKWIIFYEDDPLKQAVIELRAASASDASAYKVTRGTSSKITIRRLWTVCKDANRFVGKYTVGKMANGLRLTKKL